MGKSFDCFVVWAFLLLGLCGCVFFRCLGGGELSWVVWAGATPLPKKEKKKNGPAKTAEKNTPPARTAKKNPPPLSSPLHSKAWLSAKNVRALHVRGRVFVVAIWAGRVLFFAVRGWKGVWVGGGGVF